MLCTSGSFRAKLYKFDESIWSGGDFFSLRLSELISISFVSISWFLGLFLSCSEYLDARAFYLPVPLTFKLSTSGDSQSCLISGMSCSFSWLSTGVGIFLVSCGGLLILFSGLEVFLICYLVSSSILLSSFVGYVLTKFLLKYFMFFIWSFFVASSLSAVGISDISLLFTDWVLLSYWFIWRPFRSPTWAEPTSCIGRSLLAVKMPVLSFWSFWLFFFYRALN